MISIRDAKSYCKDYENIENYEEALNSPEKWDCHHRNEEYYSQTDLKKLGLYYDCPPCELIFLKRSEHHKLNSKCRRVSEAKKGKALSNEHKNHISEAHKGKHFSEEHKHKLSEIHKGENNPLYGKHHSENTKQKQSDTLKGRHLKLIDGKRVWY